MYVLSTSFGRLASIPLISYNINNNILSILYLFILCFIHLTINLQIKSINEQFYCADLQNHYNNKAITNI